MASSDDDRTDQPSLERGADSGYVPWRGRRRKHDKLAAERTETSVGKVKPLPMSDSAMNTEEWLLTYGDMVTLLLTMFVLLVMSADFEKIKKMEPGTGLRGLLEAIVELRFDSPYADDFSDRKFEEKDEMVLVPKGTSLTAITNEDLARIERREDLLTQIRKRLFEEKLDIYITADSERDGIRLNLPNSLLFVPGSSDLLPQGRGLLTGLSDLLRDGDYTISVEGHTDSSDQELTEYPSVWELSALRAALVTRLMIAAGVAPERFEVVGYGDTRPLTDNATEAGRTENRRVEIFLRL